MDAFSLGKSACNHEALASMTRISITNDPSAGSPTETLLRLLLSLGVQVYVSSK